MKVLVIDTETSGLFDFKQPADAAGQPRLAQFGAIYCDLDSEQVEEQRVGMHIQPDGWEMDPGAGAVNGLTTAFLRENGVPVAEALNAYEKAILDGYTVVAFNAQFDTKVMRAEFRRAGRPDLFEQTPNVCVMRPMMKLGVVKASGGGGFPKLSDCCAHFGITHEKRHDAIGDAEAALAILVELNRLGMIPRPRVHYAKNRP